MATRRVITSGVAGTSPGKAVFNRLEINDFIKKEKQFSLYVQALARLMTVPINTPESFYQIAGIHGAPYVAYNGAGEAPHTPAPARFLGYCSHSSVLFPTWHRPYVALIEQEIQRLAMDIAKTYESFSEDWIDAAVELRQPYWDWSSTAGPPRELYDMTKFETLQILLAPKGAVGPFPNPFLRYKFQAAPADFPTPFDQPIWRDTTHRWGEIVGGVVKDSLEDLDM
ncbi:hypothetical protein C2E23DRAFT_442984 [Lenzites betulinus]|nr:hypothetical protein C2E23DRAFT_442984 [Lenzites betulinus]